MLPPVLNIFSFAQISKVASPILKHIELNPPQLYLGLHCIGDDYLESRNSQERTIRYKLELQRVTPSASGGQWLHRPHRLLAAALPRPLRAGHGPTPAREGCGTWRCPRCHLVVWLLLQKLRDHVLGTPAAVQVLSSCHTLGEGGVRVSLLSKDFTESEFLLMPSRNPAAAGGGPDTRGAAKRGRGGLSQGSTPARP